MFTLSAGTAEIIIGVITLFFAYVISVTITGFLRSWISDVMGDSTPKELGFLTLNPLRHIDVLGIVFLYLIGFGWGQYIVVLPERVDSKWRALIIQFSDTIAHAMLYFLGSFALMFMFGQSMLVVTIVTLYSRIPLYKFIVSQLPETSSFASIVVLIVVGITCLNLILTVVSLLRNMVLPLTRILLQNVSLYWQHSFLINFLALLVALMLFGNALLYFLLDIAFRAGVALVAFFT